LPRYLQALLNCPASQKYFALAAQGTTMEGLNMSSIGELYVAVPSLGEQQALLKHIAQVHSKLGELSGNATRAIDLLRERRSALITAAVTGQIDVRDAVAA
ncbi:MAG: restriction endonuclease subunit S, partial [Aquabacterium sp.]